MEREATRKIQICLCIDRLVRRFGLVRTRSNPFSLPRCSSFSLPSLGLVRNWPDGVKKKHALWTNLSFLKKLSPFGLDITKKQCVQCITANYCVFTMSCKKYIFFEYPTTKTINFECLIANFAKLFIQYQLFLFCLSCRNHI